MKNYIGISRDHTISMRSIVKPAARDFNSTIASIDANATLHEIDTVVTVVECGHGHTRECKAVVTNSSTRALRPMREGEYVANGPGTPLWDSVGMLAEMLQAVPDADNPDVSFMVFAITDGDDNSSVKYSPRTLGALIRKLESTDRWTFVFRVPVGQGRYIAQALGINEGNIQEWSQTDAGVAQASNRDKEAFTQYYTDLKSGKKATKRFYTDLSEASVQDIATVMKDVSSELVTMRVTPKDEGAEIRPFIETHLGGAAMLKGGGFYQLTKVEPKVQDNKKILIRDKATQAVYFGTAARQMLGLPKYGTVRVAPGNHGGFDIFVQSTSVNRKLASGTDLLYWANVGTRYTEGPSAR